MGRLLEFSLKSTMQASYERIELDCRYRFLEGPQASPSNNWLAVKIAYVHNCGLNRRDNFGTRYRRKLISRIVRFAFRHECTLPFEKVRTKEALDL